MLRTRIIVDLPSAETQRTLKLWEEIRAFFGATIDRHSGREALSVGGMALVAGVVAAFHQAGIRNAIAFLVDKKVIYKDTADRADDLGLILEACQKLRIIERPFGEMHLVLTHRENGMHLLADVRISREVVLGQAEMCVTLAGRIEALRIQAGERADTYARRVREFAHAPGAAQAWVRAFQAIATRVGVTLQAMLGGGRIAVEPATITLILPGPVQVGRFRHLTFGSGVTRPKYRPAPARQRLGAYADPFYYYYFDPYYDFMTYVVLEAMDERHPGWPELRVIDQTGRTILDGVGRAAAALVRGLFRQEPVGFGDDGGLLVASDIPAVDVLGLDALDHATDADAWGIDASADDAGANGDGGGDGGGGDGGGSSCGSSCGGGCGGY